MDATGDGPARDLEARLRAASDAIQLMVQQVAALEAQKRRIDPDDERFVELAALVRSAAAELFELTTTEEAFARELGTRPASAELPSIEAVAPRQDLSAILEEWREVERRLETIEPGSPEAVDLVARFERLRAEYGRATEAKRHGSGEG